MQITDPVINQKLTTVLEKDVIKFIPLFMFFFGCFTVLFINQLIKGKALA